VRRWLIAAALIAVASGRAAAQVGYDPQRSPFLDLEHRQEISFLVGPYLAKKDPAGVAPRDGVLTSLFYSWRAGGPANITGELGYISASRTVLDPRKPEATRNLGKQSWPLYTADVGLTVNLTGPRSWHHIVPVVNAGAGFVSDFKAKADTGGYKFGTRFAFTWGGGVRWVPGGRWSLRADAKNRLYTVAYPDFYYFPPQPAGGNPIPPILERDVAKSRWTNNTALTIGISYLFSR
jgi:hypothetical protein